VSRIFIVEGPAPNGSLFYLSVRSVYSEHFECVNHLVEQCNFFVGAMEAQTLHFCPFILARPLSRGTLMEVGVES
jgi:hypothetical protein